MMRLLIILALIFLIVWVGRSVLEDLKILSSRRRTASQKRTTKKKSPSSPHLPVTDKLVQDPVCGVYCAKSAAYTAIWKGKVYYFCSEECRQKFLKERSSASSG